MVDSPITSQDGTLGFSPQFRQMLRHALNRRDRASFSRSCTCPGGGGGAGQAGYGLDERDRKGVGVCVFCGGWAVLWKHLHMFRQYLQQAAHRPRQRHIHMLWVCSALPRGTRLIYAWEASARDVASDLRRAHIASRLVVVV